jgi:hypothetical protein
MHSMKRAYLLAVRQSLHESDLAARAKARLIIPRAGDWGF